MVPHTSHFCARRRCTTSLRALYTCLEQTDRTHKCSQHLHCELRCPLSTRLPLSHPHVETMDRLLIPGIRYSIPSRSQPVFEENDSLRPQSASLVWLPHSSCRTPTTGWNTPSCWTKNNKGKSVRRSFPFPSLRLRDTSSKLEAFCHSSCNQCHNVLIPVDLVRLDNL